MCTFKFCLVVIMFIAVSHTFFFAKIFLHCTSVVDRGMCRNKYGHGNKYSHDPWMYIVNKLINRLIAVTRL